MPSIDYSIKDISKVIKRVDGKIKNVETTRLTAPGENYISLVLRVNFEVEKNGHTKTLSTVAKRFTMGDKKKDKMNIDLMNNEIRWYTDVVPLLTDFANENGIELDIFPKYYGSRYSLDSSKRQADRDSVLLLENLIPEGYKNEDRYIGFDLITAKAILKALALFHALPIALKIKKPDQFKTLKDYLDSCKQFGPPSGSNDPDHPKHFGPPPGVKSPNEMLLTVISDIPDCAPYISKIEPIIKNQKGPMDFGDLAPEPWNTITHNDCWVNNIMINTEKKNPLVKIVDFQMCSYRSYARDLVFLLLTSTRNDVIKEYIDDLLRFYYDEFTAVLEHTNTNLKLAYGDFLEEVRRVAKETEVAHSINFSTIIFGEKGTGVDVAIEKIDFFVTMNHMIQNMNSYQKEKLVVMAAEATRKNWI